MDKENGNYKAHVFVCTNQKKGECCAEHGAEEIRRELKDWTKEHPEWRKRIRINSSGCLDRCKEGVAVAIYPQNKWLVNVRKKNIDEIKQMIESIMSEPESDSEKMTEKKES